MGVPDDNSFNRTIHSSPFIYIPTQQGAVDEVLVGLDNRNARAFALAHLRATTRHLQPTYCAAHDSGSTCSARVSCAMRTLFPHAPESNNSSGDAGAEVLVTRSEALRADARLLAAAARAYRRRRQVALKPPSKGNLLLAEMRQREDPSRYVRSDPTVPRCRGYTFDGPSTPPERRLSPSEMDEVDDDYDNEVENNTSDPTLPRCSGYVFVNPPPPPAPNPAADWFATVTAISDSSESGGSGSDFSSRADSSSVNGSSANSSPAPREGAELAKHHHHQRPPLRRHKSPSSGRSRPPPPRVATAPGSRRKGNTSSSLDRPTPEKDAQPSSSPTSTSATDALLEAAALGCAPLSLSVLNDRFDASSSHHGPALPDESSFWSTPGSSAMNTSNNANLGGDGPPSGWASPGRFEHANGSAPSGRDGPSSLDVTF